MAALIQNPAKCEVHSVIHFLNAKGECLAEIHRQITVDYGVIMTQQNVLKWCQASEQRTNVHKEQWSGRPSLVS